MKMLLDFLIFTQSSEKTRSISVFKSISIIVFLYLCVKYYQGQKKPRVVCKAENSILKNPEFLKERFRPSFFLFNGFTQTVFGGIVNKKQIKPNYTEEVLKYEDGGNMILEWLYFDEVHKDEDSKSKGIVTILPGLTGNSKEYYVTHTVNEAIQNGYDAVVINHRGGYPGSKITTPKLYCAASSWDYKEAVEYIKTKRPNSPIFAVGFSLGANILAKYLGEESCKSVVEAAVCISSPLDMEKASIHLENTLRI